MLPTRTLAVFDFDHTLTSWDTAARFFAWLLRRSPSKLAAAILLAPLLGPLLIVPRTRKLPVRVAVWVATFGLSHHQLRALAKLHVSRVEEGGERFVRQDARSRVAHHLAQGHEVVVATGALEVLVQEILAAEAVHGVSVVGSSVRRCLGGMVADRHCFGAEKIPMLSERGFHSPFAFVYSDHHADLPLFNAGQKRYIVNPRSASASILRASLGESASILSWR